VIERPDAILDNLSGLDVKVVLADIRKAGSIDSALDGCDVLFHVAANPRLWARDKHEFWRTNAEGTRNVIASAHSRSVPRVVYTSTESIIGPSVDGSPSNEETPARKEDMIGRYCLSKFAAEQIALQAANNGMDIVVVNPTVPIGAGDVNRGPISYLIVEFLRGRILAYMNCALNVVDVASVAEGHILAWKKGQRGKRYFLGDQDISVLQLLQMVSDIAGGSPPRVRIPYPVGLAFAYASEFLSNHVTGREPCATVTGVKLTRRMSRLDCSLARRELGFEAGDLRQALTNAIVWYAARGWVPVKESRLTIRATD